MIEVKDRPRNRTAQSRRNMDAKPFRGLYRTVAWAYVTNGTMSFQVPEAEYRGFGYDPDYSELGWKEDYDAAIARSLRQGV